MVPARTKLPFDDRGEHLARPREVVVSHHVAEAVCLLELTTGDRDPLADLAGRLGRTLAEPALELLDVGGDEDRARARHLRLHVERAVRLELEHADAPVRRDPVDLRAERPVAPVGHVLDPLEERRLLRARRELLVGEEPVLATVLLTGPLRPGRRGDRDLELRDPLEDRADQRPLPGARGTGDDDDGSHRIHGRLPARSPAEPAITCC